MGAGIFVSALIHYPCMSVREWMISRKVQSKLQPTYGTSLSYLLHILTPKQLCLTVTPHKYRNPSSAIQNVQKVIKSSTQCLPWRNMKSTWRYRFSISTFDLFSHTNIDTLISNCTLLFGVLKEIPRKTHERKQQ
jgi:hypothetical protein